MEKRGEVMVRSESEKKEGAQGMSYTKVLRPDSSKRAREPK